MPGLPLSGVKVIELTTYVAAPMCGRMLCDLGAEVIKIEPPTGDVWRHLRRNVINTPSGTINSMFQITNAGKKSVILNLKDANDMASFHKLLSQADVFITNTRIGSLKKMGLDHDTLCEKYPHLIYGLLTGYGEEGPDALKPGFDLVAFFSMSGALLDMSCTDNSYPASAPTGAGDTTAGTTLLAGILAALYKKKETGLGDFVSVSLYNTGLWVFNTPIMRASEPYKTEKRSSRADMCPLATMYRCKDNEWIQVSIMDEAKLGPVFFNLLGVPELNDDPRFNTAQGRMQYSRELFDIVEPIFLTKDSVEWLELIQKNDIVCSRLCHFSDVVTSPQAWANGYLEKFTFSNGETAVMPTSPIRLSSIGTAPSKKAPELGADTDDVLSLL